MMAPAPRDRATEETTQRRRRMDGTLDQSLDMKLAVPPAIEAQHGQSHRLRWFNDVGPRIYNATERDDWDRVPDVDPRPVGTDEHGKPIMAHLLMKPLAFDAEDQARKDVRRREVEQQALSGAPTDPEGRDARDADKRFAVDGNRVSHSYSP
ncbi:hypothetical protein [Sphingomonas melonis]|uniref:Uncharacterized protein n=1 Tax=Sphingomonas melonis TaxID=152682 RepID=A0A7Y9FK54_9SPHN|nr:hypothetical protein [Sphingomonas melonis]NYD88754.1 hypothetical protein [Sphingomonas melonis]